MIKNLNLSVLAFLFCFVLFAQSSKEIAVKNFAIEAQKVKAHFRKEGDPLKIKAADFLLKNLYSHKTLECLFIDPEGKIFEFDEFDYDNIELADDDLKCFKKDGGNYKIKAKYDIENVKADFIIENVNSSIDAWQSSPWKDKYDFAIFSEYILPYRNTTEPLVSNWKKKYYELYRPVITEADDVSDPVSVCTALLQEMDYFEFLMKRANPQPSLSIDQIHFRKAGSCIDLASVSVLNARALGLAVTYDFTPYNAASSNSHYWNTIINSDGKHIPFNGNLDMPYTYDANYRRLGKVLRRVFSNPKNNLTRFVNKKNIPEKKLRERHVIDVTDEYVDTHTINYDFKESILDNIGYITVFNKGIWKALWWGKADKNGGITYFKMGSNIVYLPAKTKRVTKNRKDKTILSLENHPIWLTKKGEQILLNPNFNDTFSCTISREKEQVGPYRDFNTVELIDGQNFDLYYWEGEWKFLTKKTVNNSSLSYDKLPKNTLFRLTPENPDGFERIFTIKSNDCTILWF